MRTACTATLAILFGLLGALPAHAEGEVKTLLTEPGKLLHREDLGQPLGKEWFGKPGDWQTVNGALRGSERKEDMHGAVRRLPLKFTSAIIQYDFKLDGAKATTLSINGTQGHICRVQIKSDGFLVQKDPDKKTGDKAVALDRCSVPIGKGEWHTLTVELHGKEMLASLDGKQIAFGSHAAIDVPKANLGFTVAGESVSFRNLRIWEALSNPSWDATRTRLLAARKSSSQ